MGTLLVIGGCVQYPREPGPTSVKAAIMLLNPPTWKSRMVQ